MKMEEFTGIKKEFDQLLRDRAILVEALKTIKTHGWPWPDGVILACKALEQVGEKEGRE